MGTCLQPKYLDSNYLLFLEGSKHKIDLIYKMVNPDSCVSASINFEFVSYVT